MAKTTSQIVAENKRKRAQERETDYQRNRQSVRTRKKEIADQRRSPTSSSGTQTARQQGLWTNQDDLLKDAREQKANGGYDALQEQIRQETWAYYSKHGDEYVQDYLDNHTMDYLPAKQEPDYSKYLNPDSPYYSPAKNFLDRQGAEYGQRPAASESYYSQYISPDSPYYNSAKDYMDRQMGEYGQSPKAKPTVKPVDAEERHADAQKVNKLVREKDRIDYVDKYTGKEYKDNFFGQFGGNYTVGRITQDSSLAWNAYLDDPTEENRRYAQTIDQMASEIQQKNRDVLSKERTLSIISKDFANYLPQLADQIKYKAGGAVAGTGAGFAVAVTTGYVPAIGKGVKAGITAASGVYSYQTMRGAAFKSLLEAGADEETARKAANNEAIISSIIEMGETGLSLALMGGGKAIDAVSGGKVTALTKKVEKIVGKNMATKFMAALFGYLANIGSEWLEEATQESVSIANEENPDVGIWQLTKNSAGTFFDAVTNPDSENRDRVVEAGEGGARLDALMGGWEIGTNAAITKAATSFNANRLYGQNPGALVQTALEVNPESVLAKNLQTKLESGKKLTGSELAKLAGETENSFRDQQRRAISTAVEQRLNEVGETGDVETIATAIAKKVMGEELSVKENHAFKNSSIGDMVLREMSQQKRESPGNNGWRNAAEYAKQGDLNAMEALNQAGLSGSMDLARANPRGYWRSFQEALKNGASYDQALMQATSETTMKVVGNQVPMGTLLYNIGGDPKKAVSVIGSILNQAGINMTPGEMNLLGIVVAEASAYQRDASFQTKVALEMLKGPKEEAWTAASETLWQEATDRVIEHGVADFDLEGTIYGSEENGAGVHLRQGIQRNDSANPGGQVRAVEAAAGGVQNQQAEAESRSGNGGKAAQASPGRVSAADLGMPGGSRKKNLTLVSETEKSPALDNARAVAKENGMKIVLFRGGNLNGVSESGKVFSARAFVKGDTMYVRGDHRDFTPEQLARHEAGHRQVEKGKVSPRQVYDRLSEIYDAIVEEKLPGGTRAKKTQYIDWVIEQYAAAYDMTEYTSEEVWEEIVCDSLADMNAFDQNTAPMVERFLENVKWEAETDVTGGVDMKTGPPDSGSVKYSIGEIKGENRDYGQGVILDTALFDNVKPRNWDKVLGDFVYKNLAGKELTMYDSEGNAETVCIAKENDRVWKEGAKRSHKVLDKMAGYRGQNTRAKAIVQLSEVLEASTSRDSTNEHTHQWMDEHGWDLRKVYLLDNGQIYEATVNIANGRDRRILYDISRVHLVDNEKRNTSKHTVTGDSQHPRYQESRAGRTQPDVSGDRIADGGENVKTKFSQELPETRKESEGPTNLTREGKVKYSLNANAKTELHKALYDVNYKGEVLLRDNTPAIMLAQKGVRDLPMSMKASHIRENVFTKLEAKKLGLSTDKSIHYHGLGETFFLQIIDGLDTVKEAYRGTKNASNQSRRQNYFLLISQFTDSDGNKVNVPVYIDEHGLVNNVIVDVNKISTVFGRENLREYIMRQVQKGDLVRIKKQKPSNQ